MKKKILIIILLLMMTGCDNKKFYLEDNLYEQGKITEITKEELDKKIEDKNSFLIFIYLPGCSSCSEFRNVLEEYINSYSIEIYAISILDLKDTPLREKVEYAPSLVIYNKGKIKDYLDATSDDDKEPLTTTLGLENWLEKYIYTTK